MLLDAAGLMRAASAGGGPGDDSAWLPVYAHADAGALLQVLAAWLPDDDQAAGLHAHHAARMARLAPAIAEQREEQRRAVAAASGVNDVAATPSTRRGMQLLPRAATVSGSTAAAASESAEERRQRQAEELAAALNALTAEQQLPVQDEADAAALTATEMAAARA